MEAIKMNYPPTYVLQYTRKWAETDRDKRTEAENNMLDDICRMVGIAAGIMKPTAENGGK